MGLRNFLDRHQSKFEKGGKYQSLAALYEMIDTFIYTPSDVTKEASHVRDGIDLKRMMSVVIVALIPCIIIAMYNAGLQANLALANLGMDSVPGFKGQILALFSSSTNPQSILGNIYHGAYYLLPLIIVSYTAGGFWEVIFASVRGHEINEGFLVTGMLYPLILPASIPSWQAALGISFGVVIGKEIFGGVGKNFLNPALTARAFLFFAYPAQISGDAVWTGVDGFSGATPLSIAASGGAEALEKMVSFSDALIGTIPGSMGETSALACLFGAFVLIITGVGSWRSMLATVIGAVGLALLLNLVNSDTNPMFSVSPGWHLVLGGFAFGTVFMTTDPVTAAMTNKGKWFYGILIGAMIILIRVVNPAYPEGVMLAILFGNTVAPVIDYYVVKGNIKRRLARNV